jgi:polyisoprenyl-phosphate glycosyltransferase
MLISVVVPAYNEEENIPLFYDEIVRVMSQTSYDWEVIFVNDGSRDRSAEVLEAFHQRDSRIHYLNLSRNFGAYPAINAGLLYAKGDGVVCITCDLQDPPELILQFIPHWEKGADIVWGVRADRADPGLKSFYANAFYWIVRKVIWPDFPSGGMDFGLFDQRVIKLYNSLAPRNTIPFFAIYNMGFRQAQIPYSRRERKHGQSNWGLLRRIKAAIDVLVDFSYVPIRAISILGYFVSFFSFTYALIVLINRLFFDIGGSGWPSTIIILALLGGVQMLAMGILGEYLWRVAEQVRGAPRFFIMSRHGIPPGESPGTTQEQYYPHAHETAVPSEKVLE